MTANGAKFAVAAVATCVVLAVALLLTTSDSTRTTAHVEPEGLTGDADAHLRVRPALSGTELPEERTKVEAAPGGARPAHDDEIWGIIQDSEGRPLAAFPVVFEYQPPPPLPPVYIPGLDNDSSPTHDPQQEANSVPRGASGDEADRRRLVSNEERQESRRRLPIHAATDQQGVLRIQLPDERFEIRAKDEDWLLEVGGTDRSSGARKITAHRVTRVRGRVVDSNGQPVAHARLQCLRWDPSVESRARELLEEWGQPSSFGFHDEAQADVPELGPRQSYAGLPSPSDGIRRFSGPIITFDVRTLIWNHVPWSSCVTELDGSFETTVRGRGGGLVIWVPAALAQGEGNHPGLRQVFDRVPSEPIELVVDDGRDLVVSVIDDAGQPVPSALVLLQDERMPVQQAAQASGRASWFWKNWRTHRALRHWRRADDRGIAHFERLPDKPLWVYVVGTRSHGWAVPLRVEEKQASAQSRVERPWRYTGKISGSDLSDLRIWAEIEAPDGAQGWPGYEISGIACNTDGTYEFLAPPAHGVRLWVEQDRTSFSAYLDTSDQVEGWRVPSRTRHLPLVRLLPPDRVDLQLVNFTSGGKPTATSVPLPGNAELIATSSTGEIMYRARVGAGGRVPDVPISRHGNHVLHVVSGDGDTRVELDEWVGQRPDGGRAWFPAVRERRKPDGSWSQDWFAMREDDP